MLRIDKEDLDEVKALQAKLRKQGIKMSLGKVAGYAAKKTKESL